MQGKAKALAQSGRSLEEVALELHLDVRIVEEYLGSSTTAAVAIASDSAPGQQDGA